MKKITISLAIFLCYSLQAQTVSKEKQDFDLLFTTVSNTGKWGASDRLGTINYIDGAKKLAALQLPSKGINVSLSFDIAVVEPMINASSFDQLSVYKHEVTSFDGWALDNFDLSYHGYTHSHMDWLSHTSVDGKMYNDVSFDSIDADGSHELGIQSLKEGIVSRGVLIDIPLLYGKDYIPSGTGISMEDILAFEKKFNVVLEKGDVVLIRTGRWIEKTQKGDWNFKERHSGPTYKVAQLLSERAVAVLGSDGVNEVSPSGIAEEPSPLHKLTLVAMGMPILDNLNLDELAATAKEEGRWDFLIMIQPLRFSKATGSPINAIAVF